MTDGLTGVANRRMLDSVLADTSGGTEPMAVLMLDLDGFKAVNDTVGHEGGDALLCAAAAAWRHQLRAGDVLARLGGDEFVAVLRGTSPGEAAAVARRLEAATPAPVSVGIGIAVGDPADGATLVQAADRHMYLAKRQRTLSATEPA